MSLSRYIKRDLDLSLLTTALVAMAIGITMIYSATFNWDLGTAGVTYQKQIVWALLAIVAMVITMVIPLKLFYAFAYIIYGLAMVMLIVVLEFGDRRWLNVGPIHIQPSELAKIAVVLALARYLSAQNIDFDRVRTFRVCSFSNNLIWVRLSCSAPSSSPCSTGRGTNPSAYSSSPLPGSAF